MPLATVVQKLTKQQKQAIDLLAKGWAVETVADGVQVTGATIRNWKKLPQFKAELAEAINLNAEASNYKLHRLFRKSLETCDQLMDSKNEHIKLGAARLAAESYAAIVRAAEDKQLLVEMEARMESLQASMQTAQPILEAAQDADFQELPFTEADYEDS